jgi:hypothetical protein
MTVSTSTAGTTYYPSKFYSLTNGVSIKHIFGNGSTSTQADDITIVVIDIDSTREQTSFYRRKI